MWEYSGIQSRKAQRNVAIKVLTIYKKHVSRRKMYNYLEARKLVKKQCDLVKAYCVEEKADCTFYGQCMLLMVFLPLSNASTVEVKVSWEKFSNDY